MSHFTHSTLALLCGALLAAMSAGCSKQPPATPSLEQTEAGLRDAFKDGAAGAKELADSAAEALEKQDRPKAFAILNSLTTSPELTPEQRMAASSAAAALREQLAQAAAKGDQEAADLMQAYRTSK